MSYGVTSAGFAIKTVEDIKTSLRERQAAAPEIGPNQDFTEQSILGQLNGTIASEIAELWELGEEVYHSQDPEAASDYALTVVASLTGTEVRAATATEVPVTLNLDAGVLVPAGSMVAVDGRPDIVCEIREDVENVGGSTDDIDGVAVCMQLGPIAINAGTLTEIVTPVTGWNSVTNALDGQQGREADGEITVRQRRADQLALRGGSTVRAIEADLLDTDTHPELDGILSVVVAENTSIATNIDGIPGKSFEVILDDGDVPSVDNDDIAQSIFDTKPGGISPFGSSSGVATDANGSAHTIPFTRVSRVDIWVTITLSTDSRYPADGDEQVKAAIVEKGGELQSDDDVIALAIKSAALTVSGVRDVTAFAIGTSPAPTLEVNIPMSLRQRAAFDTSRVAVS